MKITGVCKHHYQPHNFFSTTDVGKLSTECAHCGTLKFPAETESLFCLKGNVQLNHSLDHSHS